jgi:hypothetical protein
MVSTGTLKQLINTLRPLTAYGPQTSTEGSRAYRGPRGWESGFKKHGGLSMNNGMVAGIYLDNNRKTCLA